MAEDKEEKKGFRVIDKRTAAEETEKKEKTKKKTKKRKKRHRQNSPLPCPR
jgi:hypothetical protein